MTEKEVPMCDIIFYDKTTERTTHMGVSPDIKKAIKEVYKKTIRSTPSVITYRTAKGEKRNVSFTDALMVVATGPAYKLPKQLINS